MSEKRRDSKNRILQNGESQRKDGKYEFKYVDVNGTRRSAYSWKLVATDKVPEGKRCELSLREMEKQIRRDLEDGISTHTANSITLNELFDTYMSTKELKQSTRTNYMYMYKNYVSDVIGKRRIGSIKYSDIKKFYNSLILEKKFKPNSMEIINTILHPVFTMAVRDGYIRTNPSDGVMAEIKKSHNWEKPKRHALTEEQQAKFIDFVANSETYNHWLPLLTVFLGTGCRVGEIIGLTWDDCNFAEGIISINHNLIYRQQDDGKCEMHITTPKTESGKRIVPMFEAVRKALLQEKKQQMKQGFNSTIIDGYSGFIFTNRCGYVHNPQTINRAIKRIYTACNEQEVEQAKKEHRQPVLIPHFSVHNLRHTFCTRFCENETDLKIIQEIMGHSDITTTMNIYNEATKERKQESFARLEGKIKIC
ncbi:integrase DNA-binding domain-containing protein [Lachnospiraceae bacterium]|uniref:integrase DNA-binding domain-containing protein n=1 Tax=Oliverpabstia intestinalis TaxID=2606633 RepID=UPI0015B4C857